MIYLLHEQKVNTINSALFDFYKRYPKPCRINVSTDKQASQFVGQIKTAPLISDGWLVVCGAKVSSDWLLKMDSDDSKNSIVVRVFNRADLNNYVYALDGQEFKVIDNYRIDKEVLTSWVMQELACDYDTAKCLCNRVNCQTGSLLRNVNLLKMLPYVGRGEVMRYVEKESKYSVSDLSSFLIGYQDLHGFKYEDAIAILYKFRYAYAWLVQRLLADVRLHLKIFSLLSTGELTLSNYQAFRKLSKDKDIRGLTDKALYRIISIFGEVSTEYLLHLELMLSTLKERPSEIYRLVILFKTV